MLSPSHESDTANGISTLLVGSCVNQDGRSSSLTAPNGPSQQAVILGALASASKQASDVGRLEMHGTGTLAGDAAEIASIRDVFVGDGSRRTSPLKVGSIKSNLGHSESTSGLSGLLNAVLAMEQGVIPPVAALKDLKAEVRNAVADGSIEV